MASLDIIIVNWNSDQQLRDCLKSLIAIKRESFVLSRVVVVDNSSNDGSVDGIEDIRLPLTVIHNKENRGFGAACNQGAKISKANYLLFLNPDTRLFEDSLEKTLAFMKHEHNQKVGIVGIQLIDDKGIVSRTCARFPTPARFFSKMLGLDRLLPSRFPSHFMTEWDHQENRIVDQVMGAFFLVRRSLFEMIDGFDERFFVYFEEVDFSFRAKQKGWLSYYLADVQAYHKGGGTSNQVRATRLFYSLHSRILYGYKHFGWGRATILTVGTLVIEFISRLGFVLYQRSLNGIIETLKGYMKLWSVIPEIIIRRGRIRA